MDPDPMNTEFTPRHTRIDVHQFHRMGELGILPPDSRIELVEGEMLDMAPIGHRHVFAVAALTQALSRYMVERSIFVLPGSSFRLSKFTELQPDLLIGLPEPARFKRHIPRPQDVHVVIEVSDSTVAYDRRRKRELYAKYGVAEYWMLDVNAGRLEVFRRLKRKQYAEEFALYAGTPIAPLAAPHIIVEWDEALITGVADDRASAEVAAGANEAEDIDGTRPPPA